MQAAASKISRTRKLSLTHLRRNLSSRIVEPDRDARSLHPYATTERRDRDFDAAIAVAGRMDELQMRSCAMCVPNPCAMDGVVWQEIGHARCRRSARRMMMRVPQAARELRAAAPQKNFTQLRTETRVDACTCAVVGE